MRPRSQFSAYQQMTKQRPVGFFCDKSLAIHRLLRFLAPIFFLIFRIFSDHLEVSSLFTIFSLAGFKQGLFFSLFSLPLAGSEVKLVSLESCCNCYDAFL